MAARLGALRRPILIAVVGIALGLAVYLLVLKDSEAEPHLTVMLPTAVIGSGSTAVVVAADGTVLSSPPPKGGSLPRISLAKPPKSGHLQGPALAQVRILAAAPEGLRPFLQSSYDGKSGVDVQLRSGIELRFGDASRAVQKWRTAAAVLASPSVTEAGYVDLHAPGRPAVGGSGNALPPPP